ncbi:hypothetical protein ABVK25_011987 [Lepraria finkii]|uniref:Uncharacterized protein n=1 Tax=Lepraria finkii TaxID=1340010 RepID=A0ABR4AJD1_9LECA
MEGNDIWGWAQDSREFGLVGQTDGTAFVEITKHESPDHGLQIFDLTKLLEVKKQWWKKFTPVVYDIYNDVTAHFDGFGASHNIVAYEEVDMIFAVGGREGEN